MKSANTPLFRTFRLLPSALLLCLGVTIWWMSDSVVWLGDDIDYRFRMKGAIWQSWGWIHSWSEYWQSQWIHYSNVNGRFVAHALVQLFNGILGQHAFAVCNAAVYVLFAVSIAKTSGTDWKLQWRGTLTVISISVVCFITKMTPTCQIGYIWMMTANLIWIREFFRRTRPSWGRVAWMGIIGVIVGNGQECVSIGVCAGLGIWWLCNFIDWRRSWMMLGYFIGTAFCALSPATLSRVATVDVPAADQLIFAIPTLVFLLILIAIAIIRTAQRSRSTESMRKPASSAAPILFWISALLCLILFNAVIGVYSCRQLFGADLCIAVLILRLLPNHRFAAFPALLAAMLTLAFWGAMIIGINEVRRQYDEILRLHASSENGAVYFDRHRVLFGGIHLENKYYEDIVGQFDNDLHHSMMKQLKHTGRKRTLALRPAIIPKPDSIAEYYPGHFVVTLQMPDSAAPPRVATVYGHRSFFGLMSYPLAPRRLEISRYSRRIPPYGVALLIPEYPMFETDSIVITKMDMAHTNP